MSEFLWFVAGYFAGSVFTFGFICWWASIHRCCKDEHEDNYI